MEKLLKGVAQGCDLGFFQVWPGCYVLSGCGWRRSRGSGLAQHCHGVTALGDGAYINTGLIVPHRKRPGRALLKGEEEDNAAHRKVRARVEHVFSRMKNYKILRDCQQRGDGLHHAVQAVARMHNLALAA